MKYEFCPNGGAWVEVSGLFDTRQYFYCDCERCKGKLYELRPVDITKKKDMDMEYVVEKARKERLWKKARSNINYDNAEKVIEFLKNNAKD